MRMMQVTVQALYKDDKINRVIRLSPAHVVAVEQDRDNTHRTVITLSHGGSCGGVLDTVEQVEAEWRHALRDEPGDYDHDEAAAFASLKHAAEIQFGPMDDGYDAPVTECSHCNETPCRCY